MVTKSIPKQKGMRCTQNYSVLASAFNQITPLASQRMPQHTFSKIMHVDRESAFVLQGYCKEQTTRYNMSQETEASMRHELICGRHNCSKEVIKSGR